MEVEKLLFYGTHLLLYTKKKAGLALKNDTDLIGGMV